MLGLKTKCYMIVCLCDSLRGKNKNLQKSKHTRKTKKHNSMFESFLKSGNAPVKLKVKISIKTKKYYQSN